MMNFIKILFKVIAWGIAGLVVFSIAMTFISSSDEEVAKQEAQKKEHNAQEVQAIKEKVHSKLKTELESNRPAVIQEIHELMERKDYLLSYRKADRFREFDDDELKQLAKTSLAKYEEVEQAKKLQEERRLATALQRMVKKTDKIEGIDWYREKSSPAYNNQNGFFVYIGQRSNSAPWMRLKIQYHAEDWLFIDSFIVVADGQRFEHNPARFERDNNSEIWEWYDENLSDEDLRMIKAIIDSKESVIRFNGRQYQRDKTISSAQKAALQHVMDAYKALGGKE